MAKYNLLSIPTTAPEGLVKKEIKKLTKGLQGELEDLQNMMYGAR